MRLNADFSERVVVRPEDYEWVDAPVPGVERMMLDRIGDEVAVAHGIEAVVEGGCESQLAGGAGRIERQ